MSVTTTPGAVVGPVAPAVLEGFEDYDGSQFRLPRYSLVQTAKQMTDWNAKLGQFHNNVTGECKDTLDVVVLAVKLAQWWGPDFEDSMKLKNAGQEVKPYCKSSNGKVPDPEIEKPPAKMCAVCPNFKGKREADGSYTPPACTAIRKVLLAEADGLVSQFTVRKSARQAVDAFVQPFFARGVHPMSVRTTITANKKSNGSNDWFEPVFKARLVERVPDEEQATYKEMLATYTAAMGAVAEADTHGEEIPEAPAPTVPNTPPVPKTPTPPPAPTVDVNDPMLPF